jgi:hypothetical protein
MAGLEVGRHGWRAIIAPDPVVTEDPCDIARDVL